MFLHFKDGSFSLWGLALTWCWRFSDLKQDCPCFHVTDFKPGEVNHVDIFLWSTEVI